MSTFCPHKKIKKYLQNQKIDLPLRCTIKLLHQNMKKLVVFGMMLMTAFTLAAKEKSDWKGKVVDEKGDPVAYANVAVLSRADSTMVCGAVTEEDGTFNIITTETDGIMMVAMLGYQTVYFTPVDGMVITLHDDTALLEAASVQAIMPKTKLTGEGLQTNIHGSVLENVGTAQDVLAKTPGVIKGQDGSLEVVGKGTPLVYINGRRMTDASELTRLQSNEIQSVEVITNPGAQYDASVRAVVRIKTVRRQGEGFGLNLNASDEQSFQWAKGNDPFGAINVNYRTGWDVTGGLPFDGAAEQELFEKLKKPYISGITFSGGDPLHPFNREEVFRLAKKIREELPDKTQWLYTGFLWEEICDIPEIALLDVVAEGKFVQELADPKIHWVGSSNQRVIDVKPTLEKGEIVLHNT